MLDAPVISIITPSYNQGEFLEETLVSVLSQEGDFFLDYLVIDGGSTDDSPEIIRRYAELLDKNEWQVRCRGIRYRWLSEPDHGQSDALMKGFKMAEGDVFAWLNSDDVYLPGTLQKITMLFGDNPGMALIYGDAQYCDEDGKVIGMYPAEAFDYEKLAWFNFICQPSAFFKKGAFDDVHGIDESLHFAIDYDLFLRIGKRFKVLYHAEIFSKYRLHEQAKTINEEIQYKNHEETLCVAIKHFDWAPLNRVYGSCYSKCVKSLPKNFVRFNFLTILIAINFTLLRSIRLNRGIRKQDIKLVTYDNLKKLFRSRTSNLVG